MHERILGEVVSLSAAFGAERTDRMRRRHLDPEDFSRLAVTGIPMLAVPEDDGGMFRSPAESIRLICESYRLLAAGDPSVALVAAMHPAVLAFWLSTPDVPGDANAAWREQRARIFQGVKDGAWWGTISSEPGSGGDHRRTKSSARRADGRWLVSGVKHFGSGSGVTSFMLTTAVPEGEDCADWFFVHTEGMAWDGSAGVTLVREWDGRGMRATQSHAMRFDDVVAERIAWPGHLDDLRVEAAAFGPTVFTAVITGVVDAAMAAAHAELDRSALGSYAQVEWADARMEAWTLAQVLEGMISSVEQGGDARVALQGKVMSAKLAESVTARLCRVVGGSTFSESNPFGQWAEDVRSLGFLRPPWSLMYESLTG
jgi:alkylation response protein AidB-like acyl-CoA dehydrogenase